MNLPKNIIPIFPFVGLQSMATPKKGIELLTPSAKCYKIIEHYEGFEEKAYQDGAGVWTVGYGFTLLWGRPVRKGDFISLEEADQIIIEKVNAVGERVRTLFSIIKIKQHQFDSLVSFAYNLGYANLRDSTLRKVILADPNNYAEIDYQFGRWINVAGNQSRGLIARRKSESLLYRKGMVRFFN